MEPEQQIQSQCKTNDLASSAQPKGPADPSSTSSPAPSTPPTAPARPRRPQRSPRVEGSIDVSEPKPPESPEAQQLSSHAEATKPNSSNQPSELSVDHGPPRLAGQKLSGHAAVSRSHIAMRAASLPQTPSYRPPLTDPTLHPQRALSVAGTTDTQTQVVEDFRVHIITWNVGSAMPPDDLTSLLGLNVGDGNTDMYIIGLQEVNSMINKRLKDVLFTDQWSEVCMDALSPFGYVLATSQRMQGMLLLVFSKYFHLPFLRGIQTQSTRTGLGGIWGNKGGVSARMNVFGHSICFLNCHLPAHMENSDQRMEDFESILQQQQFEGLSFSLSHSMVFWFGDLNFRIDDLDMQVVKAAIDSNKLSTLWEKDQLNMAKDSETVLEGFHEGPIKFPPTYKFDVGTDTYDTSGKKRKPAWTDRILWRLRPMAQVSNSMSRRSSLSGLTSGTCVSQHFYRSHMEYTVSDHKPVSSIFTLQFPYKVDMPLVTLFVEDEWREISDAVANFKAAPNFPRSSWDWIGLYKVGFKHHKDYASYVWAKQEESDFLRQEHQVIFTEEELPKDSGDFILGYYSNNMSSIVGVTEPFQIQLPASTAAGLSPSDSSDFTSDDELKKSDSCDSCPETEEQQSSSWSSRRAEGPTANPDEPYSKDTSAPSSSSRSSDAPAAAADDSSNSGKDATKPEEP
ncbi:inositol polyphosphate 5-phosphatase K [Sinocyclocheilus anshuiensis]|uniref:inositol polyphosphate 5-phosphatase K n=1 Tax=Sinocyclocheilus anshuiensis TaxID=1608454 RepID=UPI0007B98963|nr:PREDICTED: inositol polyphosphate 5-phosphatase K-like [Sinocyclocheilus anshuiensis]